MLQILDPGILNTIQDAGRWGYQAYGVPVAGAMDLFSFRMANDLVRNPPESAAIEIHSSLACEMERPCLLAFTGAEVIVDVNGRTMPMWTSLFVRGGSLVEIKPLAGGWAYLAIHGGVDVTPVLGSRSTYVRGGFGGLEGRALGAGDIVPIGPAMLSDLVGSAGRRAPDRDIAHARRKPPVRVLPGPHQDHFADQALTALTSAEYVVTESADRMGYRLRGCALERRTGGELVSCGVPLGALQVPPDGQPIVLMADHQTTGGYPIIATVVSEDIPVVAQCKVGEPVTFKVLS